ncbi:MAG TPA: hypothetical protein VFV38_35640 [Ktedonobacteraceae bacterium]|nr:hypothetical protein [Ktedonobacteraceae bacterium]
MDVDYRAAVYEEVLGFRHRGATSYRVVQLTPPGSECSVQETELKEVLPYLAFYAGSSTIQRRELWNTNS